MERANDSSYDEAVDEYIAKHPQRVDYWVTGKL
jgi:glycine betaine/proline transport system substrate-binding protein